MYRQKEEGEKEVCKDEEKRWYSYKVNIHENRQRLCSNNILEFVEWLNVGNERGKFLPPIEIEYERRYVPGKDRKSVV